jgi:hypothetical protein
VVRKIVFDQSPSHTYCTFWTTDGREVKIAVDQVKRLSSNLISADYPGSPIPSGNQLRDSVHKWLSPPDPSTNHNIACGTRHKKLASWFFEGSIFQDWKSTGSLLWVHGKRSHHPLSNFTPADSVLYCSRFWQKRTLVCRFSIVPLRGN